ncbi:MAG TPA: hypothetical protein ENH88_15925 [Pseudoalteromonas prydzensis]|uniref:Uncharacterized protein n=1 Tax=Pseudoalteromonas prydzensis TaxID=182141 RepID=A0A7V1D0Y5_9GAMM|nr:hypothetical protein [Pseudoalteromonas prydzensis]HEA17897.1 hypothetical protein [Pseudoalteromonas prydzensis]
MTIPIGSGFYTGDIPGKITPKQLTTNKPQGLLEQPVADNKKSAEFVKSSQAGIALADKLQSETVPPSYRQTIYDQPTAKVSRAISTYTEFANLERRAEVQNLIGVDIYA